MAVRRPSERFVLNLTAPPFQNCALQFRKSDLEEKGNKRTEEQNVMITR